ncbi:MAG: hypothetical protein H7251_13935 [Acetobacteraceae bacterium]|nr:hypothetical protein [Acetobacteraceae bacterium]
MTETKPSILRGMGQLARLRGAGITQFPTTRQAFFNSLAPWLALPLVGGVMLLLGGQFQAAIGNLLFAIVALLAPAVVSHALARWWGREAGWLRYAIAFNWCQWVITAGGLTGLLLGEIALQIGMPRNAVLIVLSLGFMGYAMAVQSTLASFALAITKLRAVGFIIMVNLVSLLLVLLPMLGRAGGAGG